jgi:ParB-like chromosome segregation protein Spo0J
MTAVDSLLPADSPRLSGEDAEHINMLAASKASFPPIVVSRKTMRVIDGMHRLRVAQIRGEREIAVVYFDGSEEDEFIRAVQLNVEHGLPLTRSDREAAAVRIIESHSEMSDRAVAALTGLSAPTIGAIRHRSGNGSQRFAARIGRDGRIRPLNSTEGRRKASMVINERPDASLREIARQAGISVATARDVRERMRRGDNPIPNKYVDQKKSVPRSTGAARTASRVRSRCVATFDFVSTLRSLRKDPSLVMTKNGRHLLQWFSVAAITADQRAELVRVIPEHCRERIAKMAEGCAEWWKQLAAEIEHQRNDAA